jgi:hypothetical protein
VNEDELLAEVRTVGADEWEQGHGGGRTPCQKTGDADTGRIQGQRLTLPRRRIMEVFATKTAQTPAAVLEACRRRLKEYDDA